MYVNAKTDTFGPICLHSNRSQHKELTALFAIRSDKGQADLVYLCEKKSYSQTLEAVRLKDKFSSKKKQ